jgi:anti-anti-sigma factor
MVTETLYVDRQMTIERATQPDGLRLSGEIDHWNAASLAANLPSGLVAGDMNVDLSRLSFCDISGIRELVTFAEGIGDGRRVVLHGLAPQLRRVLHLVGWAQVPALAICDCGAGPC